MYVLIIKNRTASTLTYLSGAIVVPGSGQLTVPSTYHFELVTDGQFRYDISTGAKADVNDGVTNYGNTDALKYIDSILQTVLPSSIAVENYNSVYVFNDISSVPSSVETTIATYTVPSGKTASINLCELSGSNIATFNLYIGASLVSRKRTYFGNLNEQMQFTNKGYELNPGEVVTLKVIHVRPDLGDFEANIQIKESL